MLVRPDPGTGQPHRPPSGFDDVTNGYVPWSTSSSRALRALQQHSFASRSSAAIAARAGVSVAMRCSSRGGVAEAPPSATSSRIQRLDGRRSRVSTWFV